MKKRSSSIELYRCLLMYGICLFHSLGQGHCNIPAISNLLKCCVIGFVLISGYFGVRFSWRKLWKLYFVAVCAISLANGVYCLLDFGPTDVRSVMARWNRDFRACWFLHAYAAMMMIAPLMDAAIEWARREMSLKDMLLVIGPFLLFVFGWGFVLAIPRLGEYIPRPAGLGTHTAFTLCGCYVVGRLYCILDVERFIAGRKMLAIIPALIGICAVGFSSYDSPFSLLLAAAAFHYVKRIHIPESLFKMILWLGGAMFSVYCFHAGTFGQALILKIEENGVGPAATALILFVAGVAAYVPIYFMLLLGRKRT